ncbi:hypothetical protein [Clostridium perfringens]|uniref:hypothetical protein n=1 Tax=Clostridium perfringens TaxID=1502 RepID=UPI001B833170|nr:hypothetical protein [Clostridium perfringens]HBC2032342.1 hypothetical protein [Clostridium perfringens]HBC2056077.1 hypothetical protein [Clostridium perfringens]HBC2069692.1 hypothetical protein [Clostridium perfringens]
MDMLEVSKKVTEKVQKQLESLKVDINLNVLIKTEIKRECIGTDQSNQCTHEKEISREL